MEKEKLSKQPPKFLQTIRDVDNGDHKTDSRTTTLQPASDCEVSFKELPGLCHCCLLEKPGNSILYTVVFM